MLSTVLGYVRRELGVLLDFASRPRDFRIKSVHGLEKFKRILALLSIDLPLMFVIILITTSFQEYTGIELGEHKLEELLREHPIFTAFFGVILAPLIEEFFFRFFITFRYAFYFWWPMNLIYTLIGKGQASKLLWLRRHWSKVFPLIFYMSVVAFGAVHITNFQEYRSYLWAIPILTLPQLVVGLFFGYTRIKYGLRWSILFHALHNGILLVPALIFEA